MYKRPVGPNFQSTVLKIDSKVSRPVHFLFWFSIFFHYFKVILSIESFAEQESPHCNMQLASIDYVYFPTAMIKLFLNELINTTFQFGSKRLKTIFI